MKQHGFFELTGALLAAALIISGCQDVLNKPEDSGTSPGKVLITIGSGMTRTLAPTAAELGITEYVLAFTCSSSSATHEDVSINSGTSETVTLAPGDWTITAEARAGTAPRARGSWNGTINENGGAVTITPVPVGPGTGTFSYTINFPDLGASGAKSLALYSVLERGGETLVSGTPVTTFTSGVAGSLSSLPAGFYRLQVVLTNSDIVLKTASKIEAVHIYPDFTTSAEWQFEPEDFDENFKTGIQVSSLPDKTIYGRDEPFAGWAGLEVSETWSDGTERVLAPSEYTITPSTIDTHDPGAYYITIAQIGATYTTGFEIMVNTTTRVLTNVTMDSPPTKLVYELGQDLDFSGMVLMGHYSDSTSAPITAYTYTGYGKTKRGTQTVTVKVNTWTFPITVEVRVPAAATITVNQYSSGSGNDFYNMALIKGRPLPDGGLPKNLKATVSANGSTVIFTKANGGLQSTDLTGYNPSQTEWQNLTLTLDDNTVNVPVFVMDVDPHLSFDYGYWRHQGNPLGGATLATPEAPQYTVPVNTELVITPVVFSMNTDTPTYSWSCSAPFTTSGPGNKYLKVIPTATGTYTATVTVTAGSETMTGTATILCTPARSQTPPPVVINPLFDSTTDLYPGSGDSTFPSRQSAIIKNPSVGQFPAGGSGYGWSLGTLGGYFVWKLRKAGTEEFEIHGNSFLGNSEPGIVWVSVDDNGDGLPNDTWYELKGSEDLDSYWRDKITRSYGLRHVRVLDYTYSGVTYDHLSMWADSKGRTDIMNLAWPTPRGVGSADRAWLELATTFLRDEGDDMRSSSSNREVAWGYVDGGAPTAAAQAGREMERFRISDAMRADGSPANLPYIDFVRVQNGMFLYGSGDLSTEIQIADGLGHITS